MKLGFVLLVTPKRPHILDRSIRSLLQTNLKGLETPVLQVIYKAPLDRYGSYYEDLRKNWTVRLLDDICIIGHDFNTLAIEGAKLLLETDITHLGFLVDDFVYNPEWMQQLTALIERRPGAKAWSIYRSRYTRHHRILYKDKDDVVMTMHDCLGVMTREEWIEYDAVHRTDFTCPPELGGGCTIDIHHAAARQGERWATGRDYMQNIDRHKGIEDVDCAIDFVGE